MNDGVERLLAYYRDRGYLMAEVSVEETPAGPGAVDLAVHVSPGPRVTIETRGLRLHEGLRRTLEPYWQKGIFLDDIVEAARDRIRSEIEDRGYLKADVTSGILENDAHAFRVRFTIRRGPRVRAGEVRVAGARQIPEKEILEELRTSPDGAFSRGIVRAGRLRADVATIQALYAARGFPRASVGPPDLAFDASGRRATVTFTVEEGPRVAVRAVRFEGASSFPEGRLAGLAALPEGAPYTQETAEAAVARLRRAYDEAGFPDARVRFRREAVAHDEESEEDDLVFTIEEGTAQVVGNVDVSGNLITRDRVVRSALTVKPGDALSRADLLDSQTRLYRRGLFTSVQAQAEASSGAPPSGPAPRDVRVEVREAAPLTQVFGIGYDSTEKFRGQYEISNRNILGNGRYLGLQTRASRIEQRASVLFRELGTFGGRYDVTASSFYENERRPAFDVRTIGSGILFGRQVTRATRILYRYSLRDVDLSEASAAFDGTTLRLSGLAGSAVHDTRDAPFEPSRGHYLGADAQLYGAGIGSEADFTKFYAQVFHFWTVLPGIVWAQAVRAGATFAFGRSRRDPAATGDAESGVPPSERFFAGGDTTLRGFKQDIVGPLDAQGGPIGGEGLFILNEELRVPIYRKLQGVVFLDLGNVFRTLPEYDIFDLRQVGGLGLRIATPIGPFRLEYGAVLDRKEDEPPGRLFFSIGQAF